MYYNNNKKNLIEPFDFKQGGLSFSFMIALYVIIAFFVQSILQSVTDSTSILYIAVSSTLSSLAIAIIVIYQCFLKRQTLKILNVKKFKLSSLLPMLLLCLGMFFGVGFVNLKFSEIMVELGVEISQPAIPLNNIWQFLLFCFTLAVLPAIFEELFFRGLLLSSLEGHKNITKVIAVGVCFALYHCNLGQFIYQFIYGVAFCLLALYAKSVIPCIIAHFINNFFIILCEYFRIYINLYNPLLIVLGLIALAAFCLITIISSKNGLEKSKGQTAKKAIVKFYILYAVFGILICLLMILSALF